MERGVYMCICVCICANNMQILGFGGVGGLGVGGIPLGGEGGVVGVRGPGSYIHIHVNDSTQRPQICIGSAGCRCLQVVLIS